MPGVEAYPLPLVLSSAPPRTGEGEPLPLGNLGLGAYAGVRGGPRCVDPPEVERRGVGGGPKLDVLGSGVPGVAPGGVIPIPGLIMYGD